MEVYSTDCPLNLVEADVVESLKAGTSNCSHSVVRNQEMFLPPHEDILSLCHTRNVKVSLPSLLLKWPESREFGPVL